MMSEAVLILLSVLIVLCIAGCGSDDAAARKELLDRLGLAKPQGPFVLWVNSYPEGATVLLNGEQYGRTPLSVESIAAGEYRLSLRLERFLQIDTVISIEENSQTELAPFVFERRLLIESNPTGAEVTLNGKETGEETPFEMDLPAIDTINFSLMHVGFDPIWLSAVNPAAGSANIPVGQFWEFETDSSSGAQRYIGSYIREITIRTVPSRAEIILEKNDSLVGYSNAPLSLPCGERRYRLNKEGFNGVSVLPYITPESQSIYVYELTRYIRVSAVDSDGPPDVDIGADIPRAERGYIVSFLDAITPATLTLVGAEQLLFFTAAGYKDTSVIIGADDTMLVVGMRRISDEAVEQHHHDDHSTPGIGSVTFIVRDRETGQEIEGAEIIAKIKAEDRMVLLGVTDSRGELSLELRTGGYEFRIGASDYKSEKKKHSVKTGDSKTFEINLKRE